MKLPLRAALIASTVLFTYGGFVLSCPQWTRELGLDVWNFDSDSDRAAEQERIGRELTMACEIGKKRLDLKSAIISDLIDERIDLSEATEMFAALNEQNLATMEYVRSTFAGANDTEKTALQVIAFTRLRLLEDSSRQEDVLNRLERQLLAMKCRKQAETTALW